jgi:GTPase SAR1 family protein
MRSYSKSNVVLICFALDSPETFNNVTSKWSVQVKEDCPKAAVLSVGIKSDLWNKSAPDAITQPQIDQVIAAIQAYKFIACSAKKNENRGKVFESFVGRPFDAQKTVSQLFDGRLRLYSGSYLFAWQESNAFTGGMCAQRYEEASLYR